MDFTTILNSRKSIRSFTGEAVSEEVLTKILKAANTAPVGLGKYDSIHLTVVKNKDLLDKLEQTTKEVFQVNERSFLYHAPELIIVSTAGNDNVSHSNAAIVTHNMALQAVECNVGACYIWGCIMALNQNPSLIKEFAIPEGFTPSCAIALGLTNESYSIRQIPENRISINYM